MADRSPHDDDDHAWLLARERGEPLPPVSDVSARRYAQLSALIVDMPAMPAGVAEREGWEQDVLAVIDADAGRPAGQSTTLKAVTDNPAPKEPTATTRHRRKVATAAVLAMAASIAIVVFMRGSPDVGPGQAGPSGSSTPDVEVTRGMHVEQGRLGFDHTVQVYRSNTAVAHELHDGDTVMTGDRIRVSVITSTDAHLYLAFCADQHLQMYPSQHGVGTKAGDLVFVPEGGGELVLDSQPGTEVLYIIVSRSELSRADPDLAARIAAIGARTTAVDCSASVDGLVKSGAPTSNVLRGERVAKQRMPPPRTGAPVGPDLARNPGDVVWYTADEASSPGTVVAADAEGIAIVRYRFIHVARENTEDHAKARDD